MSTLAAPPLDVDKIRADFPILDRQVNGHPMVYLDSAATSQKPQVVLTAMADYYAGHNGNVSRSVHTVGTEATEAYEGARAKVAGFIGAASPQEVVFTKNVTEAVNLVAYAFLAATTGGGDERFRLRPGDSVVVTEMEHHSNLVPWQLLCERTGATLRWFGITDDGRLDLSRLDEIVDERTKLVSFTHVSNVLGTINPTAPVVARAREVGALVMLDSAQAVPKLPVNVADLGVDFMGFTGHKMCGPTGIGVLWGRAELLDVMPPFLGGGSMIETVTMEGSTFAALPAKFEAGTPPIAEAIGLAAAIDYLNDIGMANIHAYEQALTAYALEALASVPDLRIFGPASAADRGGLVSFDLAGVHPHDVGQVLDSQGVEVRVGHHCARPACRRFGVAATTRASFYLYNTEAEVDALVRGLAHVRKVFG
ncbi:MAG TPA: cysteine desulfurase [Natronosporangium sp.]|nr:cysteine desulfurase [Natronosporangium sp.]